MEVQVDLEDQMYARQLERALQSRQRTRSGARPEDGFWALPIEEVLPAPEHIPESFRGKSWAQIEEEDEEKVEKLVQQFRKDKFICYFDSESLARYTEQWLGLVSESKHLHSLLLDSKQTNVLIRFGRRSHKKEKGYEMVVVADGDFLPLVEQCEPDGSECVKKTKRRMFKMASRCQVREIHNPSAPDFAVTVFPF